MEDNIFQTNPITGVISESLTPVTLLTNVFLARSEITLYIPEGTATAYTNAEWISFKSVNEVVVADTFIIDEIVYSIIPSSDILGKVKTIDYLGANSSIVIPSLVEYEALYNVGVIGADSFSENALTSVTIPNSITIIEDSAFKDNLLSNVIIPNSVIDIGSRAFMFNSLTSIEIPANVTTIGSFAFLDNSIASVTFPNGILNIGSSAFRLNMLTNVIIPNSITSIEAFTFSNNSLINITIPNSVNNIDQGAFINNSLANITIPIMKCN